MNKRGAIKWIVIIGVIVLLGGWLIGRYNGMVAGQQSVEQQWANVENVYQRRMDLIPNLVNTVKGSAQFEQKTLTDVVEARAKATSVTIDPTNMTEDNLKSFQEAQGQLSSALSRLLVTVERYPELKTTEQFLALQQQLEGTENRIAVERKRFNDVAGGYNTMIRSFPNNILAGMFGFQMKPYFEAEPGAEKAPVVDFNPEGNK